MGVYLNPGNDNYVESSIRKTFVDKSGMIAVMNRFIDEGEKYICISRLRRFGKTMTGNMLAAYYSKGCDSRKLFGSSNISKTSGWEDKLNKYKTGTVYRFFAIVAKS